MTRRSLIAFYLSTVALCVTAQQATGGTTPQGRGGGPGGGPAAPLFTAIDTNKDGAVTRDEMKTSFGEWYGKWDVKKTSALAADQIGGLFKFHWNDGQSITVKLDDPKHPLNAPFRGQPYVIVDETYTFGRDTYSRQNLRVLTSIDYAKMSAEDKAKEQNPRANGDYALSWIRREGWLPPSGGR